MATSKSKKYLIQNSFYYKGHDGKTKQSVIIGPGEELPKLDSDQILKLLAEGKIVELDLYGEAIPNIKENRLNAEEIDRLFQGKSPEMILKMLTTSAFDVDTLSRMQVAAERHKMSGAVMQKIESLI